MANGLFAFEQYGGHLLQNFMKLELNEADTDTLYPIMEGSFKNWNIEQRQADKLKQYNELKSELGL